MQRPQVALDAGKDSEGGGQQGPQIINIPLTRLALNTQRWRADRNTLDLVFLGSSKLAVVIGPRAKVPIGRLRQVLQHFSRRAPADRLHGISKVLEINWPDIKGVDFVNRLCEDGRLVLEAGAFQQLTFPEVESAWAHVEQLWTRVFPDSPVQQRANSAELPGTRYLLGDVEGSSLLRRSSSAILPICRTAKYRHHAPASPSVSSGEGKDTGPEDSLRLGFSSIQIFFSSPQLPLQLRPIIEGDVRLLKMYESGLPAWACFLPRYGLWYRPWFRRAAYLAFIAISIFSMAVGFWDLYKNVPYVDQVVRGLVRSLRLPGLPLFRWLERHAALRMSILLTYLFGKSELATQMLQQLLMAFRILGRTLRPLSNFLQPAITAIQGALQAASLAVRMWGTAARVVVAGTLGSAWGEVATAALAACSMARTTLQPFGVAAAWMYSLILPLLQAFRVGLLAPYGLVVAIWQSAAPVRFAVMSIASSSHQGQESVLYTASSVLRVSLMKIVKGMQAVIRFIIQVCCDIYKHRLTLALRARRGN
ncbi:hypothetical protein WJX84_006075 [Apatococcus fuscideae]|uniref:Uncharacterized protein n=1 Tax=Apatococcus fuscideae TaxID=2026836 RepID=A0AAW1SD33_9CHLO